MTSVPNPANCNGKSFVVGQDGDGHWLAVETHGLGGGLFVSREAALHYALMETARRPGTVVMASAAILLMMSRRYAA